MEAGEFPRELLQQMGELGLMGITTPEHLGGSGMDLHLILLRLMNYQK